MDRSLRSLHKRWISKYNFVDLILQGDVVIWVLLLPHPLLILSTGVRDAGVGGGGAYVSIYGILS